MTAGLRTEPGPGDTAEVEELNPRPHIRPGCGDGPEGSQGGSPPDSAESTKIVSGGKRPPIDSPKMPTD